MTRALFRNPVPALAAWLMFMPFISLPAAPAFPGALGFGANATGGRGGTVYHVTTLADSGGGSFRAAVSSPNRIVVFDVGGYISLMSAVSVKSSITIAGQTAPGGGIGFKGGEISFANSTNIICRYLRIRPGSDTASTSDDALSFYRAANIICDHVSLEFAPWNNIDGVSDDWQNYPVTAITVQHSIIANPTYQQFGAHTECVNGTWSWFYNVFANSHNRNPLAKINTIFINNVLYNYQAGYTTHTSTSFKHDIVNNYFIFGPATGSDNTWYQIDANQSIYDSGNLKDNDENGVLSGAPTSPYWYQGTGTVLGAPWSSLTATIPTFSAPTAYRYDISSAGALPLDPIDALVISQVKTLGNGPVGTGAGTAGPDGGLYTSQAQTGLGNNGYGVINGGVLPLDSDGDGMPDFWEQAAGSNPGANDAMALEADGYARIEKYLNWLADPHAQTTTNTPVVVDLWQYTSGFTNASPVYRVGPAGSGSVTLSNGHFAVFTPAAGFSGLGSFQFSVQVADGSAYTNTVSVAISALQPPSNLTWRGDGAANVWSTTAPNWVDGVNLVTFDTGDNVTFDDAGSNAPAITLSGSIAAGTVSVVAEQDYTFSGGALIGGTSLRKVGTGKLTLLNLNTFSGGTTIQEGIVQLGDGVSLNGSLGGSVTNHDELVFANPTALTSSASISGAGRLTKLGAGTLTLTGNQSFTNSTIIAAGTLELAGAPPLGDITNNGALTFKPAGAVVCPGDISGFGSVALNSSGATVYLTGANSYTGGTTNTAGNLVLSNNTAAGSGPVIYQGGSVMVGGGVVITNDFSMPGSSTTDLSLQGTNGTGIWAGNVVNLGTGASWRPGADTGGSLVFTGTANQGGRNFIVPRGSVQFASNAVVSATGEATAFGRDTTGGNRSANVTIKDNATVLLGPCSLGGNQAGGNVTVTLQNNATLSTGANPLNLHYVARSTAVTTLRLNGGTLLVSGFSKTNSSSTNVVLFNGGVLKAGANNAAFLPAFNAASSSNLVQAGGARIDDGGYAITVGASLSHDPGLVGPDGGLTKLGGGTLTFLTPQTYTGPTLISGGILKLSCSAACGTIAGSTNLHIAAGAYLDVSSPGSFTLGAGRTLWGNGTVIGNFILGNSAILAPGSNAIGRLTFSTAVTLAPGSTNLLEVSKSPLTNDVVQCSGNVTLGGALVVSHLAGSLGAGDVFKLVDAPGYSGAFSTVILPPLNPGLAWNTSQLNSAGIVSVVSTAPPVFGPVGFSGNALVFAGSNGPANSAYCVLSTTNLNLPLALWTRIVTNQFDAAGNFAFTNGIAPATPPTYFRLQLP